jgi:formylglycine-generating enzyme required for sulfatase activity
MRNLITLTVILVAVIGQTKPVASNIRLTAGAHAGDMKVTYDLVCEPGEKAVITWDLEIDGQRVGFENLITVAGDINKVVSAGTDLSFTWTPDPAWANTHDLMSASAVVTAWETASPPPYMAVSTVVTNLVRYYPAAEALPGGTGATNDLYKGEWVLMRKIPAAGVTWQMGVNSVDNKTSHSRSANHTVTLTEDFYMAVYVLTRQQYANLTGGDMPNDANRFLPQGVSYNSMRGSVGDEIDWPTKPVGDIYGVKNDSGFDIIRKFTGVRFDYATDAQWEYACRAGVGTLWNNGSNEVAGYSDVCWNKYNSGGAYHEVGLKKGNNWGLYDMHGNIWEYVLDWNQDVLTDETDPKGPSTGSARVYRGGVYYQDWNYCNSAHRNNGNPDGSGFGIRMTCPVAAAQ